MSVAPKSAQSALGSQVPSQAPSGNQAAAAPAAAPAGTAQAASTPASPNAAAAAASNLASPNAALTAGASASPKAASAQPASAAAPAAVPATVPAAAVPAIVPAAALATPEAALSQARSELAAGHVQGALDALDRLMALAPSGIDEAYLLYGKALEAKGPLKDIKRSYAYYKKLVRRLSREPLLGRGRGARGLYRTALF